MLSALACKGYSGYPPARPHQMSRRVIVLELRILMPNSGLLTAS
jgi:hypothetical protein